MTSIDEDFDPLANFIQQADKPAQTQGSLMKKTFDNLKNENNELPFKSFLNFEGIQGMISKEVLRAADLELIWKRCVDKDLKPADFGEFLKVNDGLDELFGQSTEAVDDPVDFENPWNPRRAINLRFVDNTVEYLRQYFDSVASVYVNATLQHKFTDENTDGFVDGTDKKMMTFQSFADWDDISEVLEGGELAPHFVKDLWQEALEYKYRGKPCKEHKKDPKHSVLNETMLRFISSKEIYSCTDPAYCIDFDTFLRLNFRLDEVVEDTVDEVDKKREQQYDLLFTREFKRVTGFQRLMTFDQFLNWDKMQELLANEALTMDDLLQLWAAVPKNYIPTDGRVLMFAPEDKSGIEAINVESFIAINNEIQTSLQSE